MCEELHNSIYPYLWQQLKDNHTLPLKLTDATLNIEPRGYLLFDVRIEVPGEKFSIAGWRVVRANGLVIIENAWVRDTFRQSGLGKFFAAFRVAAFNQMRESECENIEQICYVNPTNEVQIHILKAVGWERVSNKLWRVK